MILHPEGFRDYDARWRTPEQIDEAGMERVGLALATLLRRRSSAPKVVTGRDWRSYSEALHGALIEGLVAGGAGVLDVRVALSPIVYDGWTRTGADGCAMLTASHNPAGWTGVKMGAGPAPLTFGPAEMAELRDLALGDGATEAPGGRRMTHDAASPWADAIAAAGPLVRPLKVVVACGSGTAGFFAPSLVARLGADVIPLACEPDWDFPHHHPNPDAPAMQAAMVAAVTESGADVAVGFDGDGDRLGAVDGRGRTLPADRLGLILARDIAERHPRARFLVDVKSTGLWQADPVLAAQGASVEIGPTGHSHMKRRLAELAALGPAAAFERSGHIFLDPPGYDDGPAAAAALLRLVARRGPLAALADAMPSTWPSPPYEPSCPDGSKHAVAGRLCDRLRTLPALGGTPVVGHVEAAGLRVELEGGSWGLIRASSNTPNLVVIAESVRGPDHRDAILRDLARLLAREPEVGPLA